VIVARVAPVGMLFVRCAGGISHSPKEGVRVDDVAAALETLDAFLDDYRPAA
jgi:allantoate deiminase